MNEGKKELLSKVIEEMEEDKKSVQRDLNRNLDRIAEINVYLKSLLDKEDSDFKVFSPRNIESIYSEQIATCNSEKNSLELENRDYYAKINKFNTLLEKLYKASSVEEEDTNKSCCENNEIKNNDNDVKYRARDSILSQEAERQRIARDLHDISLQNLTAIIHKVELASMYVNQDPIRTKLELSTISNSLKETINEIRETIFDLRPMTFDDIGFKELLDSLIEKETENNDIDIIIDKYELSVEDRVVLMVLFRIIRETLGNSVRHSKCTEIHISIDDSQNNEVVYDIVDNGIGFDVNEKIKQNNKHYGLIILEERVKLMQGEINFDSSKDKGTRIHITIPLDNIKKE